MGQDVITFLCVQYFVVTVVSKLLSVTVILRSALTKRLVFIFKTVTTMLTYLQTTSVNENEMTT